MTQFCPFYWYCDCEQDDDVKYCQLDNYSEDESDDVNDSQVSVTLAIADFPPEREEFETLSEFRQAYDRWVGSFEGDVMSEVQNTEVFSESGAIFSIFGEQTVLDLGNAIFSHPSDDCLSDISPDTLHTTVVSLDTGEMRRLLQFIEDNNLQVDQGVIIV